tara:strand:- start:317 stop:946 length:630 start_codon:yes stop_codon:yes gene_type:complete
MSTIKTWQERCIEDKGRGLYAGYMHAEITELRDHVSYLNAYIDGQKDAMRETMAELERVREALGVVGLERCEFDDTCDYCDTPEQGVFTRLIHNAEDCTEAAFYICGGCLWNAIPPKAKAAQPPKDHEVAKLVSDLTQIATVYHDHQSLRQRISNRVLETVKAAQPVNELVEAAERVSWKYGHDNNGTPSDWDEWKNLRAALATHQRAG